ncbi:MAG: hypothetical protein U5K69_28805 [Balneolaceae bacterium]|nr:hypothetical protein [Balneolaceae bacterium]
MLQGLKYPLQGLLLGVGGRAVAAPAFDVDRLVSDGGDGRLITVAFFIGAGRIPFFGGDNLVVVVQVVAVLLVELTGNL